MYTLQYSIHCMHTINGHACSAKSTLNMTLLLLLPTHAGMVQQNTDVNTYILVEFAIWLIVSLLLQHECNMLVSLSL